MTRILLLVLALATSAPATRAHAEDASARSRLLVDVDWLAEHLHDPDLVLLQVGSQEQYDIEHIPGAIFATTRAVAAPRVDDDPKALQLELPEPDELVDTLETWGIGDGSHVVVYYGNDWVTPSARILFTLQWIGLGDRTSLLDGGMNAWKKQGHEVTDEVSTPERASLTPHVQSDLVVDAAWVKDHLTDDHVQIIDARAPVDFRGIEATSLNRVPVRKGHIPGATNVPFTEVVDDDLFIKSPGELQKIFADAGLTEGKTAVGYCHLGQYATLMLFAARTLGVPVKLYDGSFQDWGSREDLPVELPDPTGR